MITLVLLEESVLKALLALSSNFTLQSCLTPHLAAPQISRSLLSVSPGAEGYFLFAHLRISVSTISHLLQPMPLPISPSHLVPPSL